MFSIYLLVVQRAKDWVQVRPYGGLWYNDYNEIPSQAPVSDDLYRPLYIYLLFWFFLQKKRKKKIENEDNNWRYYTFNICFPNSLVNNMFNRDNAFDDRTRRHISNKKELIK